MPREMTVMASKTEPFARISDEAAPALCFHGPAWGRRQEEEQQS